MPTYQPEIMVDLCKLIDYMLIWCLFPIGFGTGDPVVNLWLL